MRKLILLAVILAGVGLYRGWITFTSEPAASTGSQEKFELSVNRDKIKADINTAEQDALDLARKGADGPK